MRNYLIIGAIAGLIFSLGGYVGMKLTEPKTFTFLAPADPGIKQWPTQRLPRTSVDPLPDQIDT